MRLNNGAADGSAYSKGGGNHRRQQQQQQRFEISDDLLNPPEESSDEDEDPLWTPGGSQVGRNVNDLRNGRAGTPASSVHSSVRTRQSVLSEQRSRASSGVSQRTLRRRRDTFSVADEPHPYGLETQNLVVKPQNGKSPSPSRTVRVVEQVAYRRETTTDEIIHNHHVHGYISQQNNGSASHYASTAATASYKQTNDADFLMSSDSETSVIEDQSDSRFRRYRRSLNLSTSHFFSSTGNYLWDIGSRVCQYVYLFLVGTFLFEKWCLHVRPRGEQAQAVAQNMATSRDVREEESQSQSWQFSSSLKEFGANLWKLIVMLLRLALVIFLLFLLWTYVEQRADHREPIPIVHTDLHYDDIEIKLRALTETVDKIKGGVNKEANLLEELKKQIIDLYSRVESVESNVEKQAKVKPEVDIEKLKAAILPILDATIHKNKNEIKDGVNEEVNVLQTKIEVLSARVESVESNVEKQAKVKPEVDIEKVKAAILPILATQIHDSVAISCKTRNCPEPLPVVGELSMEDVEAMIKRAIAKYDADKTGLPDLALESAGGSILSTRCTKSSELRNSVISYWGFRLWSPPNTPRTIIQPGVVPGECWAFEGSVGDVVIKLAVPAIVTGFTMEHIPKTISRNSNIDSAPKHFQVLGLQSEHDATEVHDYGSFTYEDNNEPLQYFAVVNATARFYPIVELKILSNHGNMRHTCLYRFRVHGAIDLSRSQNGGATIKIKSPIAEESNNLDATKNSNPQVL